MQTTNYLKQNEQILMTTNRYQTAKLLLCETVTYLQKQKLNSKMVDHFFGHSYTKKYSHELCDKK